MSSPRTASHFGSSIAPVLPVTQIRIKSPPRFRHGSTSWRMKFHLNVYTMGTGEFRSPFTINVPETTFELVIGIRSAKRRLNPLPVSELLLDWVKLFTVAAPSHWVWRL